MAPERLQNPLEVDVRIDIYAVGAVAYELVAARPILELGDNNLDLLFRVVEEEVRPLREVAEIEVPEGLGDLVMHCLAKNREERPASIEDMLVRLDLLAREHLWSREQAAEWWRVWRGDS